MHPFKFISWQFHMMVSYLNKHRGPFYATVITEILLGQTE